MVASDEPTEFERERARLLAVAYRLLGSASEAEDAVQDTFLRWTRADRSTIQNTAAWLTTVLTNLCLTQLTSARVRRERYIGPWLPEPVLTADDAFGPLETAELRDTVSMAFLLLLERLTPPERAVFVLREAFAYSHREIAAILGLTEANCQQLYRRARQHVAQERRRGTTSPEEGRKVTQHFLAAAHSGDLAGLEQVLAADVVSWADGGGTTPAAKRPVQGAQRVARYLNWMSRDLPGVWARITEVNAQPGFLVFIDRRLVLAAALDVTGDRITALRIVNNPDKLSFLARQIS